MSDSRSQKCDLTPCFPESSFSKSELFLEGNFLFLPVSHSEWLCFFILVVKMGRSSYTVEFKLKAVSRLKTAFHGNISQASRMLGIDRKQLREWTKL